MDQDRQIRLLIPPFFLLLALLWGAYLDPSVKLAPLLLPASAQSLLGVLAAATVCVLPLGFLLSAISILLLRILFSLSRNPGYEARITAEALRRIWPQLHTNSPFDTNHTLYAVATYDHELLSNGIHSWLMRRWNLFNVSIHSAVSVVLAHGVGALLGLSQNRRWTAFTSLIVVILLANAIVAWRQTMAMIEFQSQRDLPPKETTPPKKAREQPS